MKVTKYHLYLTDSEKALLMKSLNDLRTSLISESRYTDAVDDLMIVLAKAKQKRISIRYIA